MVQHLRMIASLRFFILLGDTPRMSEEGIVTIDRIDSILGGIPVFEVSNAFGDETMPIILGENTLDDVRAFATSIETKATFVQYDYIEPEMMILDTEDLDMEALFGENADAAKSMIDEHNAYIESVDWSKPYAMAVFVLFQGQAFGMQVFDEEVDYDALSTADEFLMDLIDVLCE